MIKCDSVPDVLRAAFLGILECLYIDAQPLLPQSAIRYVSAVAVHQGNKAGSVQTMVLAQLCPFTKACCILSSPRSHEAHLLVDFYNTLVFVRDELKPGEERTWRLQRSCAAHISRLLVLSSILYANSARASYFNHLWLLRYYLPQNMASSETLDYARSALWLMVDGIN